jgi:hypothetical protein
MTKPRDQKINKLAALADFLFRVTTARMRPEATWPAGRLTFLDQWTAEGGRLRQAGPRWFTVWGSDYPRMDRLRTLVLPAPWIDLSDEEMTAVLLSQLRHVQPGMPETPWLSSALGRARARIRLEAVRFD